MEEEKNIDYYKNQCYRLKSKLKNCENRKYENLYFKLKKKLEDEGIETYIQENKKLKQINADLYIQLNELRKLKGLQNINSDESLETYKLKNNKIIQRNAYLTRRNNELEERLKQLKAIEKEIEIKTDKIKALKQTIKLQKNEMLKLKLYINSYKESLKLLVFKNKQIFRKYFDKIAEEDELKTSFNTIIIDFEYISVFMKLFEMHIFDYIVERQDPDNKTEQDTTNLIIDCKDYSMKMIKSLLYCSNVDIVKCKKSLRDFVNQYVEDRYRWRNNAN